MTTEVLDVQDDEVLDPDLFPFTVDEVYRALLPTMSELEAVEASRQLAHVAQESRASQLRAAAARARGSTDPGEINGSQWGVSFELFVLLADVSDELATRVEAFAARERTALHSRFNER